MKEESIRYMLSSKSVRADGRSSVKFRVRWAFSKPRLVYGQDTGPKCVQNNGGM